MCANRVSPTLQQDADLFTRQSSQRYVLLFYDDEPDEIINFFLYCTNLTQSDSSMATPTFQILQVYGNGPNEERILKKTFNKAVANVKQMHIISEYQIVCFRMFGFYFIVFIIIHRFYLMLKHLYGNFVPNVHHRHRQYLVFGLVFNVNIHFHLLCITCVQLLIFLGHYQ